MSGPVSDPTIPTSKSRPWSGAWSSQATRRPDDPGRGRRAHSGWVCRLARGRPIAGHCGAGKQPGRSRQCPHCLSETGATPDRDRFLVSIIPVHGDDGGIVRVSLRLVGQDVLGVAVSPAGHLPMGGGVHPLASGRHYFPVGRWLVVSGTVQGPGKKRGNSSRLATVAPRKL